MTQQSTEETSGSVFHGFGHSWDQIISWGQNLAWDTRGETLSQGEYSVDDSFLCLKPHCSEWKAYVKWTLVWVQTVQHQQLRLLQPSSTLLLHTTGALPQLSSKSGSIKLLALTCIRLPPSSWENWKLLLLQDIHLCHKSNTSFLWRLLSFITITVCHRCHKIDTDNSIFIVLKKILKDWCSVDRSEFTLNTGIYLWSSLGNSSKIYPHASLLS